MELQYSPGDHLAGLTQKWIGSILLMGAVLFPTLEFMDYFALPDKFMRFMVYRLVISAILVVLYFLNKLRKNKPYQYVIAAVGATLSAVTVELAVLQSGGQSSSYYAAMMILTICCLGFAPIGMPLSFLLIGIVYGIYVVPIMLTENITGGVFVSNNAFLISMFIIGLLLRYNNQKLLVSELQLRAELSEDKNKLERYSDSLEGLVSEKTGALAITEQKYRALFDNANDGIAVLDRAGNITDANYRFCELHGFERDAVLGTHFRILEIERRRGEIDERLKEILDGKSVVYEAEHYRKDGSRIFLEVSSRAIDIGGVLHIQSFHRDITEKKKLQEQVLQSQKMESMGVLAGGIAHDFNNVLTAILGHTEVLRRHIGSDEFAQKRIKTVEDAARRADLMVSKLLSFARKETLELAPTDLNSVVLDTLELLGRTLLKRSIAVKVKTDPALPTISGDSIHLEQVITNLVMNAMDAMPGGGTISILTSVADLGPNAPHVHPLLIPGKYVVLTVSDTGQGIPREIRDRIFDPFFTTKPVGKGTGLGLAMVYGLVKSHKGEVRVQGEEGAGTTFEIYLPARKETVNRPAPEPVDSSRLVASGNRRILAVDDEPDVLSYIKDTLDAHGYTTIVAEDPVYALKLFQELSGDVDLVITDMIMPLMNGAELAGKVKEMKQTIKVIGISGYVEETLLHEPGGIDLFVKKPFDGVTLLKVVREALDKRGETRGAFEHYGKKQV